MVQYRVDLEMEVIYGFGVAQVPRFHDHVIEFAQIETFHDYLLLEARVDVLEFRPRFFENFLDHKTCKAIGDCLVLILQGSESRETEA